MDIFTSSRLIVDGVSNVFNSIQKRRRFPIHIVYLYTIQESNIHFCIVMGKSIKNVGH